MKLRLSVCSTLATIVALASTAPLHAQGVRVELSGGAIDPTGPTSGNVDAGFHVGLGLSRQLPTTPLSLGVEASFARFGERLLDYAVNYPCMAPGCTLSQQPTNGHLALANYFVTGKYRLGGGKVHPYVAAAGGVTQQWSSSTYNGSLHAHGLGAGGRAGAGIEAQLGGATIGVDLSYAAESGLKYEGDPVRYVPVTLRLSF